MICNFILEVLDVLWSAFVFQERESIRHKDDHESIDRFPCVDNKDGEQGKLWEFFSLCFAPDLGGCLGGCAIEHFSECPVGISKPIKLFVVSIVGFISSNESIVQPKVVNGPIEIFYGADS